MINITKDNMKEEVLDSELPVLIKFTADWCRPCQVVQPIVEKFAEENADVVKVVKIDTEITPELAAEHGIRGIPTFVFYNKGEIVSQVINRESDFKSQLNTMLEEIAN